MGSGGIISVFDPLGKSLEEKNLFEVHDKNDLRQKRKASFSIFWSSPFLLLKAKPFFRMKTGVKINKVDVVRKRNEGVAPIKAEIKKRKPCRIKSV